MLGEQLVGVSQQKRLAVGAGEGVLAFADDVAQFRIAVDVIGAAGHVNSGGVLVRGETVGVDEAGVVHAHLARLGVHQLGETGNGPRRVAGQGHGYVIEAADHQGIEQFPAGIDFSGAEAQLGGIRLGVGRLDNHLPVQAAVFKDDHGRHEFLRAGYLAVLESVVGEKHFSGEGVHDAGAGTAGRAGGARRNGYRTRGKVGGAGKGVGYRLGKLRGNGRCQGDVIT